MRVAVHKLETRLVAIRRLIQLGQEALAAEKDVDLSVLSSEIEDISEMLRTAPSQINREAYRTLSKYRNS